MASRECRVSVRERTDVCLALIARDRHLPTKGKRWDETCVIFVMAWFFQSKYWCSKIVAGIGD